jgi:hypothetical protein
MRIGKEARRRLDERLRVEVAALEALIADRVNPDESLANLHRRRAAVASEPAVAGELASPQPAPPQSGGRSSDQL